MKNIITSALLLFTLVFRLQAQDTIPLAFEEAVRIGISQNLDFQMLNNQQEVLRAEKINATFSHLPRVNMGSTLGRNIGQQFQQVEGELIVSNEIQDYITGNVDVSMPIFNGARRINLTLARRHFEDAGKHDIARAKEDVVFNVAQQYLQVLLDEQLYNIALENLENQKKQLEQIEGFVDAGLRTLSDLYNQQSEVARLETVALDARIQWETDLWTLAETLQLESNKIPQPIAVGVESFGSDLATLSYSELYELAVINRKDLLQQQSLEEGNRKMLAVSRGLLYPQLNAFFNYSTFSTSFDQRPMREQFFTIYPQRSFGLRLNIPIFNNFDNRTEVIRSKVDLKNQGLQKRALERQVAQEVKLSYENYRAAIRREQATKIQLKAAEEAQMAISERFRLGVSNFVDLAQANQQMVTAQSDFAQAQYTLYFQDIIMRYALGILDTMD
ncbi:MAG: TolC family protein [Mongoliibacter sp.]|uniref:TolC family protein n=1 Tax=Mongoliibacter sp. TaxID=2022438 RepID=UPI0012F1A314|nr:TolC family protein [Mongoliibacter sp.]TVP50401.1 MAG: TolC family protein [Mongoliibacter sp.]